MWWELYRRHSFYRSENVTHSRGVIKIWNTTSYGYHTHHIYVWFVAYVQRSIEAFKKKKSYYIFVWMTYAHGFVRVPTVKGDIWPRGFYKVNFPPFEPNVRRNATTYAKPNVIQADNTPPQSSKVDVVWCILNRLLVCLLSQKIRSIHK